MLETVAAAAASCKVWIGDCRGEVVNGRAASEMFSCVLCGFRMSCTSILLSYGAHCALPYENPMFLTSTVIRFFRSIYRLKLNSVLWELVGYVVDICFYLDYWQWWIQKLCTEDAKLLCIN